MILNDPFAGTPGQNIAGTTPATTTGSDQWGSTLAEGTFAYAEGGGAVSSGSASNYEIDIALTGHPGGIGSYATSVATTNRSDSPTIYLRADAGGFGANVVAITFNYNSNLVELLVIDGGSIVLNTSESHTSASFALATGTVYPVTIDLGATALTVAVGGTTLYDAVAIPANSNSRAYLRQQGPDAGAVTFGAFTLAPASGSAPTTATVTGPASPIVGTLSGSYTITTPTPVLADTVFTPVITGFAATHPATVTMSAGQSTVLFAITPSTAAAGTVTATSPGITVTGQSATSSAGTTATLEAPAAPRGPTGATSQTFVLTLSQAAPSGGLTFTLGGGGGGTFAQGGTTVTSVTIAAGQTTAGFQFHPVASGTFHISATSPGITVSPATVDYAAITPAATVNVNPIAIGASGQATVTGIDVVDGTYPSWTSSNTDRIMVVALTGAYTRVGAGDATLTALGYIGGLPAQNVNTPTITTASTSPATSFTVTPPSPASGPAGTASGPFSVQPNGPTTGTWTPTPIAGVAFNPATLTWTNEATAKTFTATRAGAGTISVNGTLGSLTPPSQGAGYTFASVPAGGELTLEYPALGIATIYFRVANPAGKSWNGSGFVATTASAWSTLAIPATDPNGVGVYSADFPASIPPGVYSIYARVRGGTTPAPADAPIGSELDATWDGLTLSHGSAGGGGGGDGISLQQLGAVLDAKLAALMVLVTPDDDGQPHPPSGYLLNDSFAEELRTDGALQAGTTATSLHFDPADVYVDDFAGPIGAGKPMSVTIVKGKGAGLTIPISSVAGQAGARTGTVPAGALPDNAVDATSRYLWQFHTAAAATADPDVEAAAVWSKVGAILPGETPAETLATIRAVAAGVSEQDNTTGEVTYHHPDGTPAITVAHDDQGNRTASTPRG